MRLLAAADIHGVLSVYRWLVTQTHSADALVLAGDLFDADFDEGQRKQAQDVIGILRDSKVPVLYIMGNDDNVSLDFEDDFIKLLHGRRVEIGEYNFVGYEYTPPFVGERFVKEDNEIAIDLLSFGPLVDDRTILVTHTAAFGSLDLCDSGNVGSRAVAEFLQRKPAMAHVHGHIHYRFGVEGNHFNVAAAATCRAMLIDLPSLRYEVINHPAQ
jgi:Icc-related predicted phosphoesterase